MKTPNNLKEIAVLTIRLFAAIFALCFFLNGVYEYYNLQSTSDAAFNFAIASIFISLYLDTAKQDRKIEGIHES